MPMVFVQEAKELEHMHRLHDTIQLVSRCIPIFMEEKPEMQQLPGEERARVYEILLRFSRNALIYLGQYVQTIREMRTIVNSANALEADDMQGIVDENSTTAMFKIGNLNCRRRTAMRQSVMYTEAARQIIIKASLDGPDVALLLARDDPVPRGVLCEVA